MKNLMIAAVFGAALAVAGCTQSDAETKPEPTSTEQKPAQTAELVTYEMHVDGMMCTNCAATVTKVLTKQEGVVDVNVNHETGKVVVHMKQGTKFDEAKARDELDIDAFKLTECKEVPAS